MARKTPAPATLRITMSDVTGSEEGTKPGMSDEQLRELLHKAITALRETGSHSKVPAAIGLDSSATLAVLLTWCRLSGLDEELSEYDALRAESSHQDAQTRAHQIVAELQRDRVLAAHVAAAFERWAT